MGLVDKKSELAGYRREFKTSPLEKKKHEHVQKFNPTPLSELKRPTVPSYAKQQTEFKSGADVKPFDNSSQLQSRTEIRRQELSSHLEFSQTPIVRVSQRERFKGQTTPNKFSNDPSFLGETTPNNFSNESQFLGESSVSEFSNNSQFLGETSLPPADNSSQFLGETTQNQFNNSSQFLGETTQPLNDNSSQYLGETTQNPFDNSSQFLGEVTNPQFDNSSQLISITTNGEFDNSTQYNDPTHVNIGRLNQVPIGAFLSNNGSQSSTLIGEVNNIQDIHAKGFTSNFQPGDKSKFNGIQKVLETVYVSTSQHARNFQGEKYSSAFSAIGQQWPNFGITKGHLRKANGKSFLDFQYEKNNARLDSPQLFGTLFDQPYILRGIENPKRRGPEYWGIGGLTFDEGLIRGGAIGSTVRAAVDVVRLGKFYASIRGVTSILKNVGLQLMNPVVEKKTPGPFPGKTRIFTPLNQIANIATQHLGLRWKRHGILPIDEGEGYEDVQSFKRTNELLSNDPGKGNRLAIMRKEAFAFKKTGGVTVPDLLVGLPFPSQIKVGGQDSFLGAGITQTTRRYDSREGPKKEQAAGYLNGISSFAGPLTSALSTILPLSQNSILGVLVSLQYFDPNNQYTYEAPYNTNRDTGETKTIEQHDFDDKSVRTVFEKVNGEDGKLNQQNVRLDIQVSDFRDNKYTIKKQYASSESPSFLQDDFASTKADDTNKFSGQGIDTDKQRENQPDGAYRQNKDVNGKNVPPVPEETDFSKIAALAYGKLPKSFKDKPTEKNDFRLQVENPEIRKYAENINWNVNNRETKYGFHSTPDKTDYPKGQNRSNYKSSLFVDKISTFDYDFSKGITSNKLNNLEEFYDDQTLGPGTRDFIKFMFTGPIELGKGKTDVILFRATLGGITDTFQPGWDPVKILGRADDAYMYKSFSRNISFDFKVYAASRIELKPMWRKLNYLASFTTPDYYSSGDNQRPMGPFMRITIGDLFHETPGFINSLTYKTDESVGWETDTFTDDKRIKTGDEGVNNGYDLQGEEAATAQLPKAVDVSVGFTIISDFRPQKFGRMYSLSGRGSNKSKYTNQWLTDNSIGGQNTTGPNLEPRAIREQEARS